MDWESGPWLAKVTDVVTVFGLSPGQCSTPQVNQQTGVRGPVHVARASWDGQVMAQAGHGAGRTWDRCPLCSAGATGSGGAASGHSLPGDSRDWVGSRGAVTTARDPKEGLHPQ